MVDSATVKNALTQLAADARADRAIIESATSGVADLDHAAEFVDNVGLAQLALAIERQRRAGETECVAEGEHALQVFRRYRRAASFDHIHCGRATDLWPDEEKTDR